MKKSRFLFICFLFSFFLNVNFAISADNSVSQNQQFSFTEMIPAEKLDTLVLKNGEEIKCKIIEIGTTEIKYKKWDNLEGPTIAILKSDVFMIKYANGTSVVVVTQPTTNTNTGEKISGDTCILAAKDANERYTANGPFWGGWWMGFLFGIIGILPALIISFTSPKEHNLNMPADKATNLEYKNCYKQQADKIKSGRTWKGFLIGLAIFVVILLLI